MNNDSVNLKKSKVSAPPKVRRTVDGLRRKAPLSNAHILPPGKVEIWEGAGLIRVTRGSEKFILKRKYGGGQRGIIKGFSRASRRRAMYALGKVENESLPLFGTLTYPDDYALDCRSWKKDFDKFLKRLFRAYPGTGVFWRLELKRRKSGEKNAGHVAPHFHFLLWGITEKKVGKVIMWGAHTWHELVGRGDENHWKFMWGLLPNSQIWMKQIESVRGSRFYCSKYVSKVDAELFYDELDGFGRIGRFWGIRGSRFIKWAQVFTLQITDHAVLDMWRMMQRYAHIRFRAYAYGSRTLLCNNPTRWGRFVLRC